MGGEEGADGGEQKWGVWGGWEERNRQGKWA